MIKKNETRGEHIFETRARPNRGYLQTIKGMLLKYFAQSIRVSGKMHVILYSK